MVNLNKLDLLGSKLRSCVDIFCLFQILLFEISRSLDAHLYSELNSNLVLFLFRWLWVGHISIDGASESSCLQSRDDCRKLLDFLVESYQINFVKLAMISEDLSEDLDHPTNQIVIRSEFLNMSAFQGEIPALGNQPQDTLILLCEQSILL